MATLFSVLSVEAIFALSKGTAREIANIKLPQGVFHIDETATVQIKGVVTKAPGTEYCSHNPLPVVDLLSCCLERAGKSRKEAQEIIEVACKEVLEGYTPRSLDRVNDVTASIQTFEASRKGTGETKTRSGATTFAGTLEVMEEIEPLPEKKGKKKSKK